MLNILNNYVLIIFCHALKYTYFDELTGILDICNMSNIQYNANYSMLFKNEF